jgi:hypothetical protein
MHVPRSHEVGDTIHHATCEYLVHNAGVWLRSAHSRRGIQTSRWRIRSSLLSAAQVMRRCETVAARSAHSCPQVHAHAPSSHARVISALCECAGRASVSPMWTLRVTHVGHHVVDPTPGVGSHAGWDSSVTGTLGAHLQAGSDAVPSGIPDAQTQHGGLQTYHPSRLTPGSDDCSTYLAPSCKPHASTRSTLCEYQECRGVGTFSTRCEQTQLPDLGPYARDLEVPCRYSDYSCGRPKYPMRVPVVPHAGTRSTLSDRLQYPFEYSEYRL